MGPVNKILEIEKPGKIYGPFYSRVGNTNPNRFTFRKFHHCTRPNVHVQGRRNRGQRGDRSSKYFGKYVYPISIKRVDYDRKISTSTLQIFDPSYGPDI